MKLSDPELVDRLAGAYVVGTLAGRARRRFERIVRDRADVQLAVARWQASLGALASSVAPRPAPSRVWAAVAARTRSDAARAGRAGNGFWRWGLGGAGVGMAMALALVLMAPTILFTPDHIALRSGGLLPQSYVGLLTDDRGDGKWLVSSLRHGRTLTIKALGPINAPPRGRLVLWALPTEGAPFVLGDAPLQGSLVSEMPESSERLLSGVRKLAVTAETDPNPAAPGIVLYSGNCAKLW